MLTVDCVDDDCKTKYSEYSELEQRNWNRIEMSYWSKK